MATKDSLARSKQSIRLKFTEEQRAAYHEAGHAVMAVHRGVGVTEASIDKTKASPALGYVAHPPVDNPGPRIDDSMTWEEKIAAEGRWWRRQSRLKTRAIKMIDFCLAGGVAESELTGERNLVGSSRDVDDAYDWAEFYCESSRQAEVLLAWRQVVVEEELLCPLLWKAVKAVAAELVAKKTLSGRDIRKIVAGCYPSVLLKRRGRRADH